MTAITVTAEHIQYWHIPLLAIFEVLLLAYGRSEARRACAITRDGRIASMLTAQDAGSHIQSALTFVKAWKAIIRRRNLSIWSVSIVTLIFSNEKTGLTDIRALIWRQGGGGTVGRQTDDFCGHAQVEPG